MFAPQRLVLCLQRLVIHLDPVPLSTCAEGGTGCGIRGSTQWYGLPLWQQAKGQHVLPNPTTMNLALGRGGLGREHTVRDPPLLPAPTLSPTSTPPGTRTRGGNQGCHGRLVGLCNKCGAPDRTPEHRNTRKPVPKIPMADANHLSGVAPDPMQPGSRGTPGGASSPDVYIHGPRGDTGPVQNHYLEGISCRNAFFWVLHPQK